MYYTPLRMLRQRTGLSENEAATRAGISRLTVRQLESAKGNPTVDSLQKAAAILDRELWVLAVPRNDPSQDSAVSVSWKVMRDGFDSWKIHFMNFVDEFRRDLDPRLILLSPPTELEPKLTALIASMSFALCEEAGFPPPAWVARTHFLESPWFVSGVENLKAISLLEAPVAFRRNNIFVMENFMKRA